MIEAPLSLTFGGGFMAQSVRALEGSAVGVDRLLLQKCDTSETI